MEDQGNYQLQPQSILPHRSLFTFTLGSPSWQKGWALGLQHRRKRWSRNNVRKVSLSAPVRWGKCSTVSRS